MYFFGQNHPNSQYSVNIIIMISDSNEVNFQWFDTEDPNISMQMLGKCFVQDFKNNSEMNARSFQLYVETAIYLFARRSKSINIRSVFQVIQKSMDIQAEDKALETKPKYEKDDCRWKRSDAQERNILKTAFLQENSDHMVKMGNKLLDFLENVKNGTFETNPDYRNLLHFCDLSEALKLKYQKEIEKLSKSKHFSTYLSDVLVAQEKVYLQVTHRRNGFLKIADNIAETISSVHECSMGSQIVDLTLDDRLGNYYEAKYNAKLSETAKKRATAIYCDVFKVESKDASNEPTLRMSARVFNQSKPTCLLATVPRSSSLPKRVKGGKKGRKRKHSKAFPSFEQSSGAETAAESGFESKDGVESENGTEDESEDGEAVTGYGFDDEDGDFGADTEDGMAKTGAGTAGPETVAGSEVGSEVETGAGTAGPETVAGSEVETGSEAGAWAAGPETVAGSEVETGAGTAGPETVQGTGFEAGAGMAGPETVQGTGFEAGVGNLGTSIGDFCSKLERGDFIYLAQRIVDILEEHFDRICPGEGLKSFVAFRHSAIRQSSAGASSISPSSSLLSPRISPRIDSILVRESSLRDSVQWKFGSILDGCESFLRDFLPKIGQPWYTSKGSAAIFPLFSNQDGHIVTAKPMWIIMIRAILFFSLKTQNPHPKFEWMKSTLMACYRNYDDTHRSITSTTCERFVEGLLYLGDVDGNKNSSSGSLSSQIETLLLQCSHQASVVIEPVLFSVTLNASGTTSNKIPMSLPIKVGSRTVVLQTFAAEYQSLSSSTTIYQICTRSGPYLQGNYYILKSDGSTTTKISFPLSWSYNSQRYTPSKLYFIESWTQPTTIVQESTLIAEPVYVGRFGAVIKADEWKEFIESNNFWVPDTMIQAFQDKLESCFQENVRSKDNFFLPCNFFSEIDTAEPDARDTFICSAFEECEISQETIIHIVCNYPTNEHWVYCDIVFCKSKIYFCDSLSTDKENSSDLSPCYQKLLEILLVVYSNRSIDFDPAQWSRINVAVPQQKERFPISKCGIFSIVNLLRGYLEGLFSLNPFKDYDLTYTVFHADFIRALKILIFTFITGEHSYEPILALFVDPNELSDSFNIVDEIRNTLKVTTVEVKKKGQEKKYFAEWFPPLVYENLKAILTTLPENFKIKSIC